jgi:hypothetical protein
LLDYLMTYALIRFIGRPVAPPQYTLFHATAKVGIIFTGYCEPRLTGRILA